MVIPEIEMPGHSNEVMAVYPELSCTGKGDGFDLCMGNPDTEVFLKKVLTEVYGSISCAIHTHWRR